MYFYVHRETEQFWQDNEPPDEREMEQIASGELHCFRKTVQFEQMNMYGEWVPVPRR